MPRTLVLVLGAMLADLAAAYPVAAQPEPLAQSLTRPEGSVRVATFNVSFYRDERGEMAEALKGGQSDQARAVAEIIQRVRPDILLLNEIDYNDDRRTLDRFRTWYLNKGWNGAAAIRYAHVYQAPVNTGVPSGHDLDRDGSVNPEGGADAWGYGNYPGQYGMAVLSRFPLDKKAIRHFRAFKWADMPEARLPDDPETPEPGDWYSAAVLDAFPLSSKSHWDVPIRLPGGAVLHLLASHPTPPGFDGPEDRNGKRNHDEIRFWADYVGPDGADYVVDDAGRAGGLPAGSRFVIAGDLNADPVDGSATSAIARLLDHPAINAARAPTSAGGVAAAARQGGGNAAQSGDPAHDTADFQDQDGVGNLRVDYVLPSRAGLTVAKTGIFWPTPDDPLFRLVGDYPFASSDHRMVWVDLRVTTD